MTNNPIYDLTASSATYFKCFSIISINQTKTCLYYYGVCLYVLGLIDAYSENGLTCGYTNLISFNFHWLTLEVSFKNQKRLSKLL